ncbi:MAG: TIGR00366 family protein, partial [Emergencia sp.]
MKEKKDKVLGAGFVDWCNRWIPNALVLAFLLTILVAVLCIIFTDSPLISSTETSTSLVDAWTGGFWNLLTFSMQMALVMLTGYILASAPICKRGLTRLAQIPNNAVTAMLMCGIVTLILFWIHWGLGMMASIVLGQQVLAASVRKGYKIHMPSLVAYIYACELCCNGISQAAPLNAATAGFLRSLTADETVASYVPEIIPLSDTCLTPSIFIQNICLFIIVTAISYFMMPKKDENIEEIGYAFAEELTAPEPPKKKAETPAEWINNSPLLNYVIGIAGMIFVVRTLMQSGIVGISLNNYNFMMLMLGLLLCVTPEQFCKCVMGAIGSTWGIIIQFPFYAGIFGLITYTGFNDVIVSLFTSISTTESFPTVSFIYSSIMNMVVPSGGSKFVIEAPYLLQVCQELQVDIPDVINAYTVGDMTTNIIQPFWALPFMGLFKI